MTKGRLEAFSDGVLAIIITIMVLELIPPEEPTLEALRPLIPTFFAYVLSFLFISLYWVNHHHLLQAAKVVDGRILWANIHLLFWLSLVPFTTAWLGETFPSQWPYAVYGMVLLMCGVAYFILSQSLIARHGKESAIAVAVGSDFKGKLSVVLLAAAVATAFVNVWIPVALDILIIIIWLIPDRRIERVLAANTKEEKK